MPIEIDDSGLDLDEIARELERNIKQEFGQILADAVAQMQLRIQSGRDVNGNQFKPYTDEYAERKAKKTGSSATVNLVWSGLMLSSIQYRIQQEGDKFIGLIYFANPIAAARALGNIEHGRDFFGFSAEQQQEIYERLQGLVK